MCAKSVKEEHKETFFQAKEENEPQRQLLDVVFKKTQGAFNAAGLFSLFCLVVLF